MNLIQTIQHFLGIKSIKKETMNYNVNKTDDEWREALSDVEYHVLRNKGTERPFTGLYYEHYDKGTYSCNACGFDLFASENKYSSGCGWPSFWGELETANIQRKLDLTHGMVRTELLCSNCGSHLGHIFNDGPMDKGGARYCINSVSLKFTPDEPAGA